MLNSVQGQILQIQQLLGFDSERPAAPEIPRDIPREPQMQYMSEDEEKRIDQEIEDSRRDGEAVADHIAEQWKKQLEAAQAEGLL